MFALLLFLLIPWSPFPPTAAALQWLLDISTISTSCWLSRPWKALVVPTCMRTTHCSEGESFSRAFIEPPTDVFGFLGDKCLLGAQQHKLCSLPLPRQSHNSQSPYYSLRWNGAGTTSILGSKQVQTQTSVRIITGIVSYKTAAHFYFTIRWKKETSIGA